MQDPYLYPGSSVLKNLENIIDADELKRAEGSITKVTLPMVYAQNFEKFNAQTVREIHRIIFDGLYDWAGEFRTIPIAKREDILGGDTVRYAYPNAIKKELDATSKEIAKLRKNEDKKA
jgi:cell filamentation protein